MRRYRLNEHVFDTIKTPEQIYWLYYLYCDGCVGSKGGGSYCVELVSKDVDQLQKWKRFIGTNRPTYLVNGAQTQRVNSQHLVEVLTKLGVVPNKTYNHSAPLFWPRNFRLQCAAIRGCIDADGCVSFHDYHNCYCITNGKKYGPYKRKLVYMAITNRNTKLLKCCKSFFNQGNVYELYTSGTYQWKVGPGSLKTILPLLNLIYKDAPQDIRLERKYQKYLEIREFINA